MILRMFEAACGLLDLGPFRNDTMRGQRELAVDFSETDIEGEVFGLPAAGWTVATDDSHTKIFHS